MTFRHTFLYVNAIDVVQHGNTDLLAFDIASKYLKKAQKKLKEYFMLKNNNSSVSNVNEMLTKVAFYPLESEVPDESASEIEQTRGNTFGASGSSACMNDSELLKLKAPAYKRPAGRPKEIRFRGSSDYYAPRVKGVQ
jgi:hypothetical protein